MPIGWGEEAWGTSPWGGTTEFPTERDAIVSSPVALVIITQDFCNNTFGVSPCTATGEKCYNTFHTCKDQANYSRGLKDYKFTSAGALLPFHGPFPLVADVDYMPTEIKDSLTVSAQLNVTMIDILHGDVGIDPYVATRSAFPDIPGHFWRKWLARNPNYRGRFIKVFEGFYGIPENEFKQTFIGKLKNIEKLSTGGIRIEAEDLLASLADIEVPEKIDCELVTDITDSQTLITLSDIDDEWATTGYVVVDDEVIYYGSRNPTTNQIDDCVRGSAGTTAATHTAKAKVGKVRHYSGNPFDILKPMLSDDAGLDAAYIDSVAFDRERDYLIWPEVSYEIDFEAFVTKPTKLRDLYFEIIELLGLRSWVAEDLKVTVSRDVPNNPGRAYATLTDKANHIANSTGADLADDETINQVTLYWDKKGTGDDDDIASYNRIDIGVNATAQSENDQGEVRERKIYCRWIRQGVNTEEETDRYISDILGRILRAETQGRSLLSAKLALKDVERKTGDWAAVDTAVLENIDGSALSSEKFQIAKRERQGNVINISLKRAYSKRILYAAPNGAPTYTNATAAQKEYGYAAGSDGLMSDGSIGYHGY